VIRLYELSSLTWVDQRTSPLFTSFISATSESTHFNFTTSWYTPIMDPNYTANTTTSHAFNSTAESLVAQRTAYCWITPEDYDKGFRDYDLPDGCQGLIETYCYPDPNAPPPTSPARIPAVCTPDRSDYNATSTPTGSPVPTPTPYQPGMIGGCTKFDKAVTNDTCDVICKRNNINLADVSSCPLRQDVFVIL
jgi:hypothetical protein